MDPTTNRPTVGRLTQPCTNQTAAEETTRQETDHKQAGKHQTSRACKGRNGNGVPWVCDSMVRHTRQQPYPRTQHNAATLLLYNRPTNRNELLRAPGPPGERKLDPVRRREYASRHASPVARASSSRLTPTENQPRWGCLQDRAFGLAPGPWAPESEVDEDVQWNPPQICV